jgi:toxin ParE1/3/4
MTEYIISPEAIEDIKAIVDYLATRNIEAGEKFLDRFEKKCRYLVQFPKIGRTYQDIRPYLRGLPLDGYIIFYRLRENSTEIMRVVKGDRDLEALFNSEE